MNTSQAIDTHPNATSSAPSPTTQRKVIGVVGSYRRHGVIDAAITEILTQAEQQGAATEKIYLLDQNIEFCTNCRTCLQEPGEKRGRCIFQDDMERVLEAIEGADSVVIGAPVNFGNINALTQRFLERCVCYGYWPWGAPMPKLRNSVRDKKAVLVSSSAAPAWMGRWFTGSIRSLKELAKMLGAKPIGVLWVGLIDPKSNTLPEQVKRQAKRFGQELAV